MSESGTMKGTITYLNTEKGWGYIIGEDDGDVKKRFFHVSSCLTHFDTLMDGDRVSFTPAMDPRGFRAIGVKRIGGEG